MKRKVVQHGRNTLTISLPTDWVKKNKIKIGDELEVTDKVTKLEVAKEKEEEKREIVVDIKEINPHIFKRILGNLYRKGYDSITLRFPDDNIKKKALDHVSSFLEMCIGMEIVSHEGKNIHTKTVATLNNDEFETALRRYFLLSLQVVDLFYDAIINKESTLFEKVLEAEKKQNTLYLYCTRVLNKTPHLSKEELLLYYILIERLEEVCDDYRDMSLYILETKNPILSNDVLELTKKAAAYLRLIYNMYYQYDENKVLEITEQRHSFTILQKTIFDNKNQKEIPLFHHLCTALVKIYEASSPIVGLHIGK